MRPDEHAGPFPQTTCRKTYGFTNRWKQAFRPTIFSASIWCPSRTLRSFSSPCRTAGSSVGSCGPSSSPNARFGLRIEPFDSFLLTSSNDCLASRTLRSFLGGRRWIRPSDRAFRLFPRPPPASGGASVSRTTTPCADSRAQSRGWREIPTLSAGFFALSPGTGEMSTGHPQPVNSVDPAGHPNQSPAGRPNRSTPHSLRHRRDTCPAEITPGVTRAASTGRMAW
jgi:hypothetical protein